MSEVVTLSARALPAYSLELDAVAPDRFGALSEREIAALPVGDGRTGGPSLGDFFDVSGGRAARVRVAGSAQLDGLGRGMAGGELVVEGAAGRWLGAGMTGGRIVVEGGVGDDAGCAMSGGLIDVRGGAGARLGGALPGASRGMTGGEILVRGDAGGWTGLGMRRGLVVVGGDAGEETGHAMIAGTVVVLGRVGAGAARWSKRGTLVVGGEVAILPTFRYACTFRPPHLRLTLVQLARRHGWRVDERFVTGRYRRYSGDMAELGRGEVLQWTDG